ncbi:MAG: NAD(P)/FAD-dependent oxidoreductase [Methanocellales archaeon]|nr:NAD(P)/FAD-dependent oxidoreductase [Methanocellales archaeon]
MKRVIIVGAGPAGLFAALTLMSKANVLVLEKGKEIYERRCPADVTECIHCKICDVIHGVGGAGGMSDGKLNLHPKIGGDLTEFVSEKRAYELIDRVDKVFIEHGAPEMDNASPEDLLRRAAAAGIEFLPIKQRHIGSDRLPVVIDSIKRYLEKGGVKFRLQTEVADILISDGKVGGVVIKKDKKVERAKSDYVVLAPGRAGSSWLSAIIKKCGIAVQHMPIDVGVRVEVPAVVYEDVVSINWDPKFRMMTPTYDDSVRTFCTSPHGFVVRDTYDDMVGVNGHSMIDRLSNNTNFAFLVRVRLTEPVEDTTAYGHSIARLATTIGGGKPLLQRLGDLRQGRRSTWRRIERSYVKPTLKAVTPGDISTALPHRIVTDILEGLHMLDQVVPGVASDSTLLYAPEIKFSAMRVITKDGFETSVDGLYTIGDGAGVSRDMVNAAATGIIAAEHLMDRL